MGALAFRRHSGFGIFHILYAPGPRIFRLWHVGFGDLFHSARKTPTILDN
jgi:hypothetical protein